MSTAFRALEITIILVCSGLLLWGRSDSNYVPQLTGEFADAFAQFQASGHLQSLWNEVCLYPLEEEQAVLIVAVDGRGEKPELRCQWRHMPIGMQEKVGIEIEEAVTDIHTDWLQCGFDDAFAEVVRSAIHKPGSSCVHLGNSPSKDVLLSYVLVGKCHYWDEFYCEEYGGGGSHCKLENADEILSVAYAVLDPQAHKTFW